MPDTKISAAADIVSVVATDMLPVARSGNTTAYHATMAEISTWANTNLPVASTTVLGGVKVDGTTVTIASGVISSSGGMPSTAVPAMDGTGSAGTATVWSRGDHVHPSDTAKAPLASPTFTGSPAAPTVTPATDSTTKIATTAFVQAVVAALHTGVTVSDTPPSSPTPGSLWWDSVGGNLYLYYQDPNSTEWVIANTGGIPDSPVNTDVYARSNAQWVDVTTSVAAAPNNTGRNLIHNGQMNISQRGTGPWTTTANYTADRWQLTFGGSDADSVTIVSLADADRAAIGDEAAVSALQQVVTGSAAANSYSAITQHVENVRRLGGKTTTLSFWARATTGTPRIGITLQQSFGTGGSPSAATVVSAGSTAALSATWTRYTVSGTFPSTSGKTLGTNGDSYSAITLWFSDAAAFSGTGIGQQSGTIQLYGVQLEIGSVATPLAKRDPADELQLCQRFYQIGSFDGAGASTGAGTWLRWSWQFPVLMRGTPTVALNVTTNNNVAASPSATVAADRISIGGTATGTASWSLTGTFTASADL